MTIVQGQNTPLLFEINPELASSDEFSATFVQGFDVMKTWDELVVTDNIIQLSLTEEESLSFREEEGCIDAKFYKDGTVIFTEIIPVTVEKRFNTNVFGDEASTASNTEIVKMTSREGTVLIKAYSPKIVNGVWWVYSDQLKDYVSTDILARGPQGVAGYTPVKGVDYVDGIDGQDGYTPVKGVDYFDGTDGYTPVKGVDYFDGTDGYTPVKGVDYVDGKDGVDGVSPKVTVSKYSGVAIVTITDKYGTKSFSINDGAKGETGQGFSIYKTYANTNAMYSDAPYVPEGSFVMITNTVEDPDNAKLYCKNKTSFSFITDMSGAQGIQGEKGDKGDRGSTPVKGVDYYTESDKQELLTHVDNYTDSIVTDFDSATTKSKIVYDPNCDSVEIPTMDDIEELSEDISHKLTEPSSGLAVGKYFKVASIVDGRAVLEACDLPLGGGNSNIKGIGYFAPSNGVGITDVGGVYIQAPTDTHIANRVSSPIRAITTNKLVKAVDSVLTSTSSSEALSTEEKLNALNRLGAEPKKGELVLIDTVVFEQDGRLDKYAEPNGTPYNFKAMMIEITFNSSIVAHEINFVAYSDSVGTNIGGRFYSGVSASYRLCRIFIDSFYDYMRTYGHISANASNSSYTGTHDNMDFVKADAIKRIVCLFKAGTTVKIYGVRA